MKALKLKLGTHMDSRRLYCLNQNPKGIYFLELYPLIGFTILPLMKIFCHTFLNCCKGYKVETWYTHGQWADVLCIPKSGPRAHNSWS